jgi:hypothetical protein
MWFYLLVERNGPKSTPPGKGRRSPLVLCVGWAAPPMRRAADFQAIVLKRELVDFGLDVRSFTTK